MDKSKLEKIKSIFSIVHEGGMDMAMARKMFGSLAESVKKVHATLRTEYASSVAMLDRKLLTHVSSVKQLLSSLENVLRKDITALERSVDSLKAEIESIEIPDISQLKEDVEAIKKIEIPEETAEGIKTKLEGLKGDERLDKSAIRGLEEEFESMRNEAVRRASGGGVTNLRIQQAFKYILKTEEPVGAIDGVNTTYTLSQPIFAVLAMSINGETVAQLPNYTIAGRSFTFSTALPAAYSGKDFEVKYI